MGRCCVLGGNISRPAVSHIYLTSLLPEASFLLREPAQAQAQAQALAPEVASGAGAGGAVGAGAAGGCGESDFDRLARRTCL